MVLDHPYIKDKYFEYYVQHPGNGNADKIKRIAKILQLNYIYRKQKGEKDQEIDHTL